MLLQSEHDVYTLASRATCQLTLTTLKQLPRYAQLKMLCVQAGPESQEENKCSARCRGGVRSLKSFYAKFCILVG